VIEPVDWKAEAHLDCHTESSRSVLHRVLLHHFDTLKEGFYHVLPLHETDVSTMNRIAVCPAQREVGRSLVGTTLLRRPVWIQKCSEWMLRVSAPIASRLHEQWRSVSSTKYYNWMTLLLFVLSRVSLTHSYIGLHTCSLSFFLQIFISIFSLFVPFVYLFSPSSSSVFLF
jgi:hypothetical protein